MIAQALKGATHGAGRSGGGRIRRTSRQGAREATDTPLSSEYSEGREGAFSCPVLQLSRSPTVPFSKL